MANVNKTKRPNNSPSRKRYWASCRLALNKIKNLIVCNGLTAKAALEQWESTRKRYREKLGVMPYTKIAKLSRYERK